jgi:integrase
MGEIRELQWSQVDLVEKKITLTAERTKNGEERVVFMEGELLDTILFQKAIRESMFPDCSWVFFITEGEGIGCFDKVWETACKSAGLDGRLFHEDIRLQLQECPKP